MDDTAVRRYFTQPTHIHLRRYEAWRAVLVEGRAQKDFDIQCHSMRLLVDEFRRSLDAGRAATAVPPPFAMLAASACEDIVIGCTRAYR